jgi:hypothetical protein
MLYFKVVKNIQLWSDMTDFECEEKKVYKRGDIVINVNPSYVETLKGCSDCVELGEL